MKACTAKNSDWSFFPLPDEPKRVLVVLDDPGLLQAAALHLASASAQIETAPNGEKAWSMLASGTVDIAVLDMSMPADGGFQLLQMIRADAPLRRLPVVVLIGPDDIASIDRAYRLGANAFTIKPVNWELLAYQLRYVVKTCRVEHGPRQANRDTRRAFNRERLRTSRYTPEPVCDVF